MCGTLATISASKSHLTPAQIFGQRVRETRERRGWTQAELAEKLHIERTTLNKIEKGSRGDIRISQLFEFAKVLDIAPVHLLTPRLEGVGMVPTPGSKPMRPRDARSWIRGEVVLGKPDPVEYLLDLPEDEQRLLLEELVLQGETSQLERLLRAESTSAQAERLLVILNKFDQARRRARKGKR